MVILGVDLGRARTGLSLCDPGEMLAVPLCVITERRGEALIQKIVDAAADHRAEEIVVGLPMNMDGSEGESALHAREVAKQIELAAGIPVFLMDERGTTITAHNYMNDTNTRGKKRKGNVDAVAATIILQDYLNYRKNQIK